MQYNVVMLVAGKSVSCAFILNYSNTRRALAASEFDTAQRSS